MSNTSLSGLVYGLFLKKRTNIWFVILSVGITQFIISLFITTIWIAYLSYNANDGMFVEFYFTRVVMRIWQVVIMSAVQIAVIPPVLKLMSKVKLPLVTS